MPWPIALLIGVLWAQGAAAAALEVDCGQPRGKVSPHLFGVGFDPRTQGERHPWSLSPSGRRWGGNTSSRFNWRLDAWNTGADWFFRNVGLAQEWGHGWERFLDENQARAVSTALTVPMLGWVAKDRSSAAFPKDRLPRQRAFDPYAAHAGDGVGPQGEPLPAPDPRTHSVAAGPRFVQDWVAAIRRKDAKRGTRSVGLYILDNEPMLWNETHRDVRPQPLGYDELWERTVAYAEAIRAADPQAVIAGPALFGWTAMHFSARDKAGGFERRPDRRAHGDLPLLVWYLQRLAEYERRFGRRLVDVIDVHFYPQGAGLGLFERGEVDPETSARRVRSTRALWDDRYVDESWIAEPVRLVPRLKEWIAQHAPGLGVAIGEYNFGAEGHPSGGLAVAEALGRFAEQGLDHAYYWTAPKEGSFAAAAFLAYRNYDGQGARFEDHLLTTRVPKGVSAFASVDGRRSRMAIVALNPSSAEAVALRVVPRGCGGTAGARHFGSSADSPALQRRALLPGPEVRVRLLPWSVNVIELGLTEEGG
jgi:hypothetical protein